MSKYLVEDTHLITVADAIRSKTGSTDPIVFPDGFATAITNIEVGSADPVLEMSETEIAFSLKNIMGTDAMMNTNPVGMTHIIENAKYRVVWDDVTYDCTAWSFTDGTTKFIGIGSTMLFSSTPSDEPFIMGTIDGEFCMVAMNADTSHKVAINFNFEAGGSEGGSDVPYSLITVTAKRAGVALEGATVTATKGETVLTGTTDSNGQCMLMATEAGTYTITATHGGYTSKTSSVAVNVNYSSTAAFFGATITVATETDATVTVEKDGVTQTVTSVDKQAVIVVCETGTYTVTSSYSGNTNTAEVSVTAETNYELPLWTMKRVLEECSWEEISAISATGEADKYFSVGDTKSVTINGTVGGKSINGTYLVYIIGFNHNSAIEGNGIHFGCFKTSDGTDVQINNIKLGDDVSSNYYKYGLTSVLGNQLKSLNGTYDSTAKTYTYTANATTITSPTSGSLIAAFPSELRNVLKCFKKYAAKKDSTASDVQNCYINLLSEREVFGSNTESVNMSDYTKQYEYYANGASKIKYYYSDGTTASNWWLRDAELSSSYNQVAVKLDGTVYSLSRGDTYAGYAPVFVV